MLRRDVARFQSERELREQQQQAQSEAAERERVNAANSVVTDVTTQPSPVALVPDAPAYQHSGHDDIEMADTSTMDFGFAADSMDMKDQEPTFAAPTAPMMQPSKPAPIIPPANASFADPTFADPTSAAPPSASKSFDDLFETPTTDNMKDMDFDSMFADMETADVGDTQNQAPLDDGMANNLGNDMSNGAADPESNININTDLDFSIDDEVSSLLPGLESYANEGTDAPGTDLSGTDLNGPGMKLDASHFDLDLSLDTQNPSAPIIPTTIAQIDQAPPAPSMQQVPVSSNPFPDDSMNDLFDYDPFADDNPPAPENTEFDDAFFGFGDE